ncbi:MAG: valine--tRNA ligase [Wolinella sp.]
MGNEETKGYNPKDFEESYYKIWEERGYFEIDGNVAIQKENHNFAIMLPPPNVTGNLHIGHALNHTLIDIIARYKRMDGFKTLWQPGTDHAGIATQNVVEKRLLKEGVAKEDLGRERFLEKVWEWKEKSGGTILKQMRKLGASCAWSRTRFTMDDGLKKSVAHAFVRLYNEGYIVQGNYMVNWCTHDGALSDIEVEYEQNHGKLYHLRYFFKESSDSLAGKNYIVVATTRPETFFGDTAVMVNPEDERYKNLIGKSLLLPLSGREIRIIADSHVDMEFGTGMVKVTPAHDPNDYEVGKKHNLDFITVFDKNGILNSYAGEFEGRERLEVREEIVARLDELGFLEKIDEHENQVGKCYRCGNVVEPYISKQWFVKKEVAQKAIERINSGEARFYPAQWKNNYNAWMRELRDWCISRQLWWGHQIPVYYCECGKQWASEESPKECPECNGKNFTQDPDVLDTWFSSALWPFSTLGWGDNGEESQWHQSDSRDFYPNSLLITGFDILFFWVARMLMMGEYFMGNLPFKDIYLHALVRDENGQKMSKSKGNVIDPLELIEKYGCDATRFSLAILCAQGRDVRLNSQQFEISKNFANKLYNATNFLLLNANKFDTLENLEPKTPLGKYMTSRFNLCVKELRECLDSYRFNDGATVLYRFLWGEFCDWGIELSKASKEAIIELGAIFRESMKLLHPYMPFISEHLYQKLGGGELTSQSSIMVERFPEIGKRDSEIEASFEVIIDAIISARRLKATLELANQKIPMLYIKAPNSVDERLLSLFIPRLAKVEAISIIENKPNKCVVDVSDRCEVYLPINELDLSPIITRLEKQKEKLNKEREKLESMLNNEKFITNAPANVLAQNKEALENLKERLGKIESELSGIKE